MGPDQATSALNRKPNRKIDGGMTLSQIRKMLYDIVNFKKLGMKVS